jgi:hypothetical protein
MRRQCRIEHDCGPLEPGRDLREQLKPLASERGFQVAEASDVPTRAVKSRDDAAGDEIAHAREDDRDRPRLPLEGSGRHGPACHDHVGLQADQLLRECSYPIDVGAAPTKVHPHVATIGPTQARKRLRERRQQSLRPGIVFVVRREHADPPHPLALLCARRVVSFDHLGGAQENRWRHREAERRGGLSVHDHLELGRKLNGQFRRLLAAQNVTGFASYYETTFGGKWLELLSEIAPGLKRAAIMFNPDTAASLFITSIETAARSLKVVPIVAPKDPKSPH